GAGSTRVSSRHAPSRHHGCAPRSKQAPGLASHALAGRTSRWLRALRSATRPPDVDRPSPRPAAPALHGALHLTQSYPPAFIELRPSTHAVRAPNERPRTSAREAVDRVGHLEHAQDGLARLDEPRADCLDEYSKWRAVRPRRR